MTPDDRSHTAVALQPATERDTRVDFFRGLALIFIFVDHIPGNVIAKLTLTNFGFADAAEIFVLLAGYAAFFAYAKVSAEGWSSGLLKVGARIRDLYAAHVLVLIVGVGTLAVAARAFQNPVYFEHVNLIPFNTAPAEAIGRALALHYQPGYLNILPLYVLLLMWLLVLLWLIRVHVALAILVSGAFWAGAGLLHANLPSYPGSYGWVFNPFAWQFLFSIGAVAAERSGRTGNLHPRSSWLLLVAVAYVLFGLLVAAPWTKLPGLGEARLLQDFRVDISKQYLSLWRVAHIVALAYIAACLIAPRAPWLTRTWAQLVTNCGQHSLPVFCLGIILSLMGFVILVEAGRGLFLQTAVNIVGIALLGLTGWMLAQHKRHRTRASAAGDDARAPGCSPSPL